MTEPKLLPCPFCGGSGLLNEEYPSGFVVCCFNTGCGDRPGCVEIGPRSRTEEGAISAWNTRPIEEKLVEALEQIAYGYSTRNFNAAYWMQQKAKTALYLYHAKESIKTE